MKETEKSKAELESLIRDVVRNYSTNNLEDFNTTLRKSKLSSAIDGIDSGILSNEIEVMPIIEYSPVLNAVANPTFRFNAELIRPYPFRNANGFANYKPAVKSSPFDVEGVCVYLQDNGLGTMMTVTDDLNNPQIINPNAGTVDYDTGTVKLTSLTVEEYTGNAIKIMARIKDGDFKAPQGRVFILRDVDVKVNIDLEEVPSR